MSYFGRKTTHAHQINIKIHPQHSIFTIQLCVQQNEHLNQTKRNLT